MMATSGIANRVKTWLISTWHVKVPDPWLEACINWIQEENGSSLLQAEINKQVFEQWLLTDLRDLEFPVLPANITDSLKCELNGFHAVQMDSLVDISLPAYSQLQKLKGKDSTNEQVTCTTQQSQKPWEAKPTRMLMLQLTDGTQHIQAMEYRPIQALNANLSPGTKMVLQGTIVCRLGVLLLKPENVKVLGGEVEALVAEYTQTKVLSRLIGVEDNTVAQHSNVQEHAAGVAAGELGQALGPSDEDLLASLEENEEFSINNGVPSESGYYSRNENSSISSSTQHQTQDSIVRCWVDDDILEFSINNGVPSESGYYSRNENSSISSSTQHQTQDSIVRQTSFPMLDQTVVHVNVANNHAIEEQFDIDDELFLEEEIQRELEEMSMSQAEVTHGSTDLPTTLSATSHASSASCTSDQNNIDIPPYTYLSTILASKSRSITCVKLKSFIVTLNGNLSHSCGLWNIKAKISDGTGYLNVEFSDDVLTELIGFTVPEMKTLKKDPSQQSTLMEGLQKCQRMLTDFCGVMTVSYNPAKEEAVVLSLQDVTEEIMQSLQKLLRS
ncbi:recQ-mediated genome instability protein 1 [Xenopus laevis]|uniref:RecQ-mediated genome instability protein 1 n=1 Tax=Xenopus laevis TaxID=8355 RepID=RMI1_XENLA|nr:recQ-mediated genome instability protein 1 [Xenopus laevis]Q6DDH2.1 RecName: Full=RecQ-mediated genome instability protein 1 [Xenopus laevis]AAH77592.1 MGC83955 protein [Xenopus laevis]